jgi:hypothetical protein
VERRRADAICIARHCILRLHHGAYSRCGRGQFARARYTSRSTGGAVRSAAYNARAAIKSERAGELYYFKYHEVLLPAGAGARFAESAVLWNAAEAAETQGRAGRPRHRAGVAVRCRHQH